VAGQYDEYRVKRGLQIVEEGKKRGVPIRLMGAVAVRIHCPEFSELHIKLQRPLTDIDVMTLKKHKKEVENIFRELGYEWYVPKWYARGRYIFIDPETKLLADVFFDKLEMCHTIDFRERLEVDYPTISLADIMLEKLQIVEINEKDIKDMIVLLREHDVGDTDQETVNGKYIAKLLADDWGFWYTATTNLKKLKDFLDKYEVLTEEDRRVVAERIDKLLDMIEKEPKTKKWQKRAKIGTKKIWYRKVEEVAR